MAFEGIRQTEEMGARMHVASAQIPLANTSWSSLSNCVLKPHTSPANVLSLKCKILLPLQVLGVNEVLLFISVACRVVQLRQRLLESANSLTKTVPGKTWFRVKHS